jgi:hypothetical protein
MALPYPGVKASTNAHCFKLRSSCYFTELGVKTPLQPESMVRVMVVS